MSSTNYVSFADPETREPRIGHFDMTANTVQQLSFLSGTYARSLYELCGKPIPRSKVKVLPSITGRDILCVGKNYAEHAKEFNSSGFDSSDKVAQPSHPVIFTKRATSINADSEEIYPHPEFTETADYEGELGVIIGKPEFRISEADAIDMYVWGYTIINDVTARERQRDHKQFYIRKSPDTFCPMGPIAVPASALPKVLTVQTVDGELRQNATTEELIFSIPFLIKTISEGQTLVPGDVLATGTPAGVGIGLKPPVYLKPSDEIIVSITGLGSLTNRVAKFASGNPTLDRVKRMSSLAPTKAGKAKSLSASTKQIHYKSLGLPSGRPIIFVHGLGGSIESWGPLIDAADLKERYSLHLFDLEGHRLSPTFPLSKLSIGSFAADLKEVFKLGNIPKCLVALKFALDHPDKISKLILLRPPPSPLPRSFSGRLYTRADVVRKDGISAVLDAVVDGGTSKRTKSSNPLAIAAIRLSLLGQDGEGYAKGCAALADATGVLNVSAIKAQTLIITGSEDAVSPPAVCQEFAKAIVNAADEAVLDDVGHWHMFED
ncbi:hypothetical protein F5Y16DRAFT_410201 [Xylariaceae sp. FL0255]|nr:hypothetical protein F5Y16DRAFT_410201 [Xylariaceae sp. FL0255]